MSLKKTILVLAALIALLLPVAGNLKNQSPWTCFGFTLDESYFAQASANWSEGKGYRMYGEKSFDPKTTAGIPLAWGAHFVHQWTGEDIAHSGRVFVYFSFFALLLVIAQTSFQREKNWLAIPFSLWFFGYFSSGISFANYFTFGFLGEATGMLFGALAYRAIDRKNFVLSGIFSAFSFIMKPTFLFFLPAVLLALCLNQLKKGMKAALGMGIILGIYFVKILSERQESLIEYLTYYQEQARQITQAVSPGTFFTYYETSGTLPIVLSLLFTFCGFWHLFRHRKNGSPSLNAAFLTFLLGVFAFLIQGHQPVSKQWSAILCFTLIGFSIHWGNWISSKFAGWIPREQVRTICLAVISTWILSVGQNSLHSYKRQPENACASKEQSAINRELRQLADRGIVNEKNLSIVSSHPYSNFLYRIGWSVKSAEKWKELKGKPHTWIAGETKEIQNRPECISHWAGETFSILKCGR